MVCAVEEIENSTLVAEGEGEGKGGGKGMCPRRSKIEFYCQVSQHFCRPLSALGVTEQNPDSSDRRALISLSMSR